MVHPVAKDYTSQQTLEKLAAIDSAADPPLLRLLRDPIGFAEPVDEPEGVVADALARADAAGMTASQQAALRHLLSRRLTLVWGPPGTGKTTFLAKGLLALGRARAAAGLPTRVMVSALTHAAIENVLSAIVEECREQGIADDLLIAKIDRWQGRARRPDGIITLRIRDITADRLAERAIAVIGGTGYQLDRIAGQATTARASTSSSSTRPRRSAFPRSRSASTDSAAGAGSSSSATTASSRRSPRASTRPRPTACPGSRPRHSPTFGSETRRVLRPTPGS